jgi:glycerol-3-phosphate acyltransferase PlsY
MGSFPTAFIAGKLLKGIDIRDFGSGNVGATNAFRTIGKGPGLVVLVIDFLKGLFAVIWLKHFLKGALVDNPDLASMDLGILLGAAAIAGHIWTVFLGFKGGKGVATTAGVMTSLGPLIVLSAFGIWLAFFLIWRYVSLASIFAAISLPVFSVIFGKDVYFIVFSAVLCFVGVLGHRPNIRRLMDGTEKKLF